MSDTSQGPGWWQASDGKWYAPELYPKDWPKPNAAADERVHGAEVVAPTEAMPEVEPDVVAPTDAPVPVEQPVEAPQSEAVPISVDPEPASAFGDAGTQPEPTQWGNPDPAAGEPTLVTGVAAIDVPEPQAPPAASPRQPVQPDPVDWSPPARTEPLGAPLAPAGTPAAASADTPGGVIAILGGILLVVGSFLAWATAAGTLTSGNVNGLSGSNGWGTLICGLAVASGGALLLARLRLWWVGAGIGVAALVALGLVIFSITDIGSTSDDLPDVLRGAGVDEATAAGAKLDLDLGIWIVAAGAAISLVAGVLALVRRQG